jgi:lincosamide nucleotidyltransferase
MGYEEARESVRKRLLEHASKDSRIVAVLDYGSTSEGRGDEWSDLDLAIFIRDKDFDSFNADWKDWSKQFGNHLVSFISGVGKPWVIYDADPIPLRVDFSFYPESEMSEIENWPNSPTRIEAMVLYDDTGENLTDLVSQIVGQSLAPSDLQAKFFQVASGFWYYLLRTHVKLIREEQWTARHDFNFIIVGNLMALLRIEANAVDRWRGSEASVAIEDEISRERLSQLDKFVPEPGIESLRNLMTEASLFGYEVCESISSNFGWEWPKQLGDRVLEVFEVSTAG